MVLGPVPPSGRELLGAPGLEWGDWLGATAPPRAPRWGPPLPRAPGGGRVRLLLVVSALLDGGVLLLLLLGLFPC